MKKKVISVCFALLILYCLLFPRQMAASVTGGLALWYRSILPTLLPFCVFSAIIVRSGIYDRIFEKLYPVTRILYPVRAPLIYPVITGFLFGFPLGSKICADLYASGKVSSKEAELACCISNNFGPAFLYNYLSVGVLGGEIPAALLFAACYLPPLLTGRVLLAAANRSSRTKSFRLSGQESAAAPPPSVPGKTKTASRSQLNMKIIDAGIMDGFTTMIKLAGYILLSALLADLLKRIPWDSSLFPCICIGATEITNGLRQIPLLPANLPLRAALAVGMVGFGGISGLLQTNAMMKATGFRLGRYVCFKLFCSLTGILLLLALLPFC